MARITLANIPHHVTQRGNAGQFLLATDSENVYLALLQKYLRLYSVALKPGDETRGQTDETRDETRGRNPGTDGTFPPGAPP